MLVQKFQAIIKNFLCDRRLWYYFVATLLFFGIFMKLDFATDTYADIAVAPSETVAVFLRAGRPFTALATAVFAFIGVGIRVINFLSFLLAIFSLAFALYLLERLIRTHLVANSVWAFLLPLLLVLNPFIIEYFMFVEKGIMFLGVLGCIIALYFYVQFLAQPSRRSLILAFVVDILAAFCYQGTLGLFIVLATIFTVKKSTNLKAFLKNTVLSVAIYATGIIVNFIFIKCITTGGRTGGEIILTESLQKILATFPELFATFGIVPRWLLPVTLATAIIIWLATLIYRRQLFARQTLQTATTLLYLTLVLALAAIAPQLAQSTASIWVVPRTAYIFASLFGIFLTLILASSTSSSHLLKLPKLTNYALLAVASLFLLVQFYRFNTISVNHYESTAIDRYRSEQLMALIAEYESAHQQEITIIAPAFDANLSYTYPGIFSAGDFNITSYATDWSDINSLNFWTGQSFARQAPSAEWQEYCRSHDWTSFSLEQINFSGSTLQICIY